MVTDWLLQYGTRILIILILGTMVWFISKKLLPPLIRCVVLRTREKESKTGMEKRMRTLVSVFMGAAKVLIITMVVFMILTALDVPIGLALAGFSIVGFSVQWLV